MIGIAEIAQHQFADLSASFLPYELVFKVPGGTSRGVLKTKETWFLKVWQTDRPDVYGIGECGMFRGLSVDDVPKFESKLTELCVNINKYKDYLGYGLITFPAMLFGLETALLDLANGGKRQILDCPLNNGEEGIRINGLIWMGELEFLKEQITKKIEAGFSCLKLKIGALKFDEEIKVLEALRKDFSAQQLELRVDANGAYDISEAKEVLRALRAQSIHSIEQPVKAGNWDAMAELCSLGICPIALDEELIGIKNDGEKRALLNYIQPPYIILKPTLVGGMSNSLEWIEMAESLGTKWWITSALESNVGLNAIAQFTSSLLAERPSRVMPQGLGTGQLFTNNIQSPLSLRSEYLFCEPTKEWSIPNI